MSYGAPHDHGCQCWRCESRRKAAIIAAAPGSPRLVRYFHPRKGGWYHARILKAGRKWAVVQDLGSKARHKMALSELVYLA